VSCAVNHSDRTEDRYLRGSGNFLFFLFPSYGHSSTEFQFVDVTERQRHQNVKYRHLLKYQFSSPIQTAVYYTARLKFRHQFQQFAVCEAQHRHDEVLWQLLSD